MIICVCNGISEKDMKQAVEDGCKDFHELLKIHKTSFKCQVCQGEVEKCFNKLLTEGK